MGTAYNPYYVSTDAGKQLGSILANAMVNSGKTQARGQYLQAQEAFKQAQMAEMAHRSGLIDAQTAEAVKRQALLEAQTGKASVEKSILANQLASQQGLEQALADTGRFSSPAEARLAALTIQAAKSSNPDEIAKAVAFNQGANMVGNPGATEPQTRVGALLMGHGPVGAYESYTVPGQQAAQTAEQAKAVAAAQARQTGGGGDTPGIASGILKGWDEFLKTPQNVGLPSTINISPMDKKTLQGVAGQYYQDQDSDAYKNPANAITKALTDRLWVNKEWQKNHWWDKDSDPASWSQNPVSYNILPAPNGGADATPAPVAASTPAPTSQFSVGQLVKQNGVTYRFDGQNWTPQ